MVEKQYLKLVKKIIDNGETIVDRTGVGTKYLTGALLTHDLRESFPILTTKKVNYKSAIAEMLGFVRGYSNYKDFENLGTKVWNANGDADYWKNSEFYTGTSGDLGRIYGVQWNNWNKDINQLYSLIDQINNNPTSRRLIVTAWNPSELKQMCLPPCHMTFQINCNPENRFMDMDVYMRSNDLGLGAPFNFVGYSALLHMIANVTNYIPRYYNHHISNAHVYLDHIDALKDQLNRDIVHSKPQLKINKKDCLYDYDIDDFEIINYVSHQPIKMKMAI